jgi:hypothetical protein
MSLADAGPDHRAVRAIADERLAATLAARLDGRMLRGLGIA